MSEHFSPKSVACDSSALISLADTCLLQALMELKQHLGGDFLMTESVRD